MSDLSAGEYVGEKRRDSILLLYYCVIILFRRILFVLKIRYYFFFISLLFAEFIYHGSGSAPPPGTHGIFRAALSAVNIHPDVYLEALIIRALYHHFSHILPLNLP